MIHKMHMVATHCKELLVNDSGHNEGTSYLFSKRGMGAKGMVFEAYSNKHECDKSKLHYTCDRLSKNQPSSHIQFCLVNAFLKCYTCSSNFQSDVSLIINKRYKVLKWQIWSVN